MVLPPVLLLAMLSAVPTALCLAKVLRHPERCPTRGLPRNLMQFGLRLQRPKRFWRSKWQVWKRPLWRWGELLMRRQSDAQMRSDEQLRRRRRGRRQ